MEAIENYPSGGDSAPLDNGAFRNILYCTAKRHPNKDVYHTTITLSCCQSTTERTFHQRIFSKVPKGEGETTHCSLPRRFSNHRFICNDN